MADLYGVRQTTGRDVIFMAELMHFGIKGMKRGIRRYQYKDGSLTPAGKIRYAKRNAEITALTGGKKQSEDSAGEITSSKKSIKQMSNDELRKYIERVNLERDAMIATTKMSEVTKSQKTRGQKILKGIADKVVIPLATKSADKIANKVIDKVLGNDKESKYTKLKKEVDTLDLLKRKAQINDFFDNRKKKSEKNSNKNAEHKDKSKSERIHPEDVTVEGSSKKDRTRTKTSSNRDDDPIDVGYRFVNEPMSNLPSTFVERGRRYLEMW